MWQSSDKVLEPDGFCVCDTAQSFLGLGKGTQVLYSAPNKRSSLCDPDNTFHTNAFSGRFSFLKQHTCPPREKHHLPFSNACVCQTYNTSTIHLLPDAPKVGHDESLCAFSECQLLFDVRLVRLFLHTETLFYSFVHNFDTALSQIKIFEK